MEQKLSLEPEELPSGAIIVWHTKRREGMVTVVTVRCSCGTERPVDIRTFSRPNFSGRCRPCEASVTFSRRSAQYLKEIQSRDVETILAGSTIHWSEAYRDERGLPVVPVTCAKCGERRPVLVQQIKSVGFLAGLMWRQTAQGDPGSDDWPDDSE